MTTRLTKYADAVMESAWLLALILAPLFFNVYSQRVFEPDKISLVRTVALFALIAGVVKALETWRRTPAEGEGESATPTERPWWRKPLVWPVLALAAAYLLSTALSVIPRQSFWGSYQRLQGTFTMLSYITLFFVTLNALRRESQWRRLQYTIILVSLPIALYGILQHYHLDSLPWGGDTSTRVAGNLGNSIFLAAYLIMALPLTLERLITAGRRMLLSEAGSTSDALMTGALLFVLVVQAVAILFTQSRGPWLGLALALYVFGLLVLTSLRQQAGGDSSLGVRDVGAGIGMGLLGLVAVGLGLAALVEISGWLGGLILLVGLVVALALYLVPLFRRQGWRWLWLSFITQSLVVGLLLVAINLSPNLYPGFKDIPYLGRLAKIMDFEEGTGRVRVLIWQGVVDMMFRPHDPLWFPDGHTDALNPIRPLIGYGPESMWVAYNRFYRPELGEIEKRNASPDRSHNETFDSIVNTGILGFLAYFALFLSMFYHALAWLGLIRDKVSRWLFFILSLGGAGIGAAIPWGIGAPEFMGVGLPLGFILGILLYITYAAFIGSEEIATLERRHLLIIALIATVMGHFMEIHFGIAIVATRTYFFILAAALVALGLDQIPLTASEAQAEAALPAAEPTPRPSRKGKGGKKHRRDRRSSGSRPVRHQATPYWRKLLPYGMILGVILLVLDWDYLTGQVGSTSAMTIFVKSWLVHLAGGKLVNGPGPLTLLVFTVVVGIVLAVGETWRPSWRGVGQAVMVFLAVSLGVWLVGGLLMATQLTQMPKGTPVDQQAHRVANFIVWFYVLLLLAGAGLAAILAWTDERRAKQLAARPILAGVAAGVMLLAALFVMARVNINLVRADVYFKIAQGSESRRDLKTALHFYDKALELAPYEDYYYLFRGRSLLEMARRTKDKQEQEDLFQQAEDTLLKALALNPLNTDHSANLARFYSTRSSYLDNPAAQKEMLRKSVEQYEHAIRLSPNAAHLHNELASVYTKLGGVDKAREQLQQSLALDPRYVDTYLRLGQLELKEENWEAAYESYHRAAELNPKDPRPYSGMAYALSKMGRTQEAIEMNQKVLSLRPQDLSALQNLALLYMEKGQYDQAMSYAQQALQVAPESQKARVQALIKQIEQKQASQP